MKIILKYLLIWLILGMCYAQIELFVRGITYLPMTFIGGTGGILLGLINFLPARLHSRMWQTCLWGTAIILLVEFTSGYIFNVQLHMNLWDYSCNPCNFKGQICLRLAIAWFFLVPFAVWMNSFLHWKLFGEENWKPQPILKMYLRLLTLK